MSTEEDKKSEAGAGSVVEDETMDSADAPKPALVSKHKYVVIFGYVGTGYHGLQMWATLLSLL